MQHDIITQYNELQSVITSVNQELNTLLAQHGKQIVESFFTPLVDLGIKQIYWTQYTPFFNDGDACEFTIYDVFINSDSETSMDNYPEWQNGWTTGWELVYSFKEFVPPNDTSWRKYTIVDIAQLEQEAISRKEYAISLGYNEPLANAVSQALANLTDKFAQSENLLKETFGDHVSIAWRHGSGFTVEHHDHD